MKCRFLLEPVRKNKTFLCLLLYTVRFYYPSMVTSSSSSSSVSGSRFKVGNSSSLSSAAPEAEASFFDATGPGVVTLGLIVVCAGSGAEEVVADGFWTGIAGVPVKEAGDSVAGAAGVSFSNRALLIFVSSFVSAGTADWVVGGSSGYTRLFKEVAGV